MAYPDIELTFRFGLFGRARYLLREAELYVYVHSLSALYEFTLDLAGLSPDVVRFSRRPRWALVGAAALGLAALALLPLAAGEHVGAARTAEWVVAGLCGVAAAALAVVFAATKRRYLELRNVYNGIPMAVLRVDQIDQRVVDEFVAELQERIDRAWDEADRGELEAELRALETLRQEGVLSEQEFRAARAKVLGLERWQLED